MTPNDERHGKQAGYVQGCRDLCCQRAHMVWMKRYRMGGARLVPSIGAQRRLQALMRIGWPLATLSRRLGRDRNYLKKVFMVERINARTHATVIALFDEFSMVVPVDTPTTNAKHQRARDLAARNGWPPPLAWTNIDDPDEQPTDWQYTPVDLKNVYHARDVDPVVVMRLLEGRRVKANTAERIEALAQWKADGGSEREFCMIHGWKAGRYGRLRLVEEAS